MDSISALNTFSEGLIRGLVNSGLSNKAIVENKPPLTRAGIVACGSKAHPIKASRNGTLFSIVSNWDMQGL